MTEHNLSITRYWEHILPMEKKNPKNLNPTRAQEWHLVVIPDAHGKLQRWRLRHTNENDT